MAIFFAHILNKAINNRMVDTKTIFVDGTHIKASANKKKFQKEQVEKAAKTYAYNLILYYLSKLNAIKASLV